MTYSTPAVIEALNRDFVCFSVDTARPGVEGRDLLRRHRLLWEPGLVFFDPRGDEIRRFVGYRAPDDFLAECAFAKAFSDFLHGKYQQAVERFRRAADHAPSAAIAPEALYWRAIAMFRQKGRDFEELANGWGEVRRRYPETTWARSGDVLDCKPTGMRVS